MEKEGAEFYQQALPLRAPADRVGRANTLNNIGIAHAWISERAKAIEYLNEAVTIMAK